MWGILRTYKNSKGKKEQEVIFNKIFNSKEECEEYIKEEINTYDTESWTPIKVIK